MLRTILTTLLSLTLSFTIFAANKNQKQIRLPKPKLHSSMRLNQTLLKRRSHRNFKNTPLTLRDISTLIWAGQGITHAKYKFRTAPSAGAIYPVTLYIVKNNGVWKASDDSRYLTLIKKGDLRQKLAEAALNQKFIAKAPVTIVFAVDYLKLAKKYGSQAKTFADIGVGHIAQNIALEAVSLGLVSVPVGGIRHNQIYKLLKLPSNQFPVYLLVIGYK